MEKSLTKAEEQVMLQLWNTGESFLREFVDAFPDPRPHQNTIATILKTLHHKGFVDIEPVGRNHLYRAAISREEYSRMRMKGFVNDYFKGSYNQLVSFFAREKEISVSELEDILRQLKK